ncbi:DUF4277 domain-containing protein, partial [Thiorhodococcus mannitoliphagus]
QMAVHIDTGSMASPRHYSSQVLNHLGLVAGMYDELGLGELIDQVLVQDEDSRNVSLGQAVKAMVLNGLSFTQRALYLTPLFFKDKPVERLLGPGITAEHELWRGAPTLGRGVFPASAPTRPQARR